MASQSPAPLNVPEWVVGDCLRSPGLMRVLSISFIMPVPSRFPPRACNRASAFWEPEHVPPRGCEDRGHWWRKRSAQNGRQCNSDRSSPVTPLNARSTRPARWFPFPPQAKNPSPSQRGAQPAPTAHRRAPWSGAAGKMGIASASADLRNV